MSDATTNPHLIGGEFQSDKYPTTPRGKVPLSCKDTTAQDLLWEYAQRRWVVDGEFSDALEAALKIAGFDPAAHPSPTYAEGRRAGLLEAAKVCESRCADVLSKQDGRDDAVDLNLRMFAALLPEIATAIRALAERDGA
jgi:hypothetical protein